MENYLPFDYYSQDNEILTAGISLGNKVQEKEIKRNKKNIQERTCMQENSSPRALSRIQMNLNDPSKSPNFPI